MAVTHDVSGDIIALMPTAAELVSEIRAFCQSHADPAEARRYARYFTEGYDAWGLGKDNPAWTAAKEDWLERYSALGIRGFLKAGELLFPSGKYEEGAVAIFFLASALDRLDTSVVPGLAKWYKAGIANWAHNDVLCGEILAPMLQSGCLPLEALAEWRASKLKYQRRAVPVAMLGLLKTEFDPATLLAFIRPMMMDEERVVHQGLGWFLRELWKKRPKPAEAFLMEWKDRAPRLIFQYATEKMKPEAKARFRRVKGPSAK